MDRATPLNYRAYQEAQRRNAEAQRELALITKPRLRDLSLVPGIIARAKVERNVLIATLYLLYEPRILWQSKRIRTGIPKAIASAMECSKAYISELTPSIRWLYQNSEPFRTRAEDFAQLCLEREEQRRLARLNAKVHQRPQ